MGEVASFGNGDRQGFSKLKHASKVDSVLRKLGLPCGLHLILFAANKNKAGRYFLIELAKRFSLSLQSTSHQLPSSQG